MITRQQCETVVRDSTWMDSYCTHRSRPADQQRNNEKDAGTLGQVGILDVLGCGMPGCRDAGMPGCRDAGMSAGLEA